MIIALIFYLLSLPCYLILSPPSIVTFAIKRDMIITFILMILHKVESYYTEEWLHCPFYKAVGEKIPGGKNTFLVFCSTFIILTHLVFMQICDNDWNYYIVAVWGGAMINEIHHVSKTFVYSTYYSGCVTAYFMVLYSMFIFFPNYALMWGVSAWVGMLVSSCIVVIAFLVFVWEVTVHEPYQPMSILITGGSTGIGAELMASFAKKDCHITICGRSKEKLDTCKERLTKLCATVTVEELDIGDEVKLKNFISEANSRKPLDLVIANACTKGTHKEEAAVNLAATITTMEHALVDMSSGTIMVMSSLGIFQTSPFESYYISIKRALFNYGVSMVPVAAKQGVKMVVCCPGMSRDSPGRFAMSYKESAEQVRIGLASKQNVIIYPYYQYIALSVFGLLPYSLQSVIYGKQLKNKDV